MSTEYSDLELEEFEAMIESARSAEDLSKVLDQLKDWAKADRFFWSNSNLIAFLGGMTSAIVAFANAKPGSNLEDLRTGNPWRLFAEVISMSLEMD